MPRRNGSFRTPTGWLAEGEWPEGVFDSDTPEVVAHAVAVAKALSAALEGRSKTEVCARAGIERSTLYDVLGGKTWADIITLAKLENTLGVVLWPVTLPEPVRRRT